MANAMNFGIIKPELAGSFAAGYEGAGMRRQQAEQARQQTAQSGQALEMNQMKMDEMKRDRAAMLQLQEQLKSHGQDPDLSKVFQSFINSGNPAQVEKGVAGMQKLKEQQSFAAILGGGGAQPMGAAQQQPQAAPSEAYPGYNQEIGMGAPANALAPRQAPAPMQPQGNALAPQQNMGDMRAKINQAYLDGSPRALAWAKAREEEMKPMVVSAGSSVFSGGQFGPRAPESSPTSVREFEFGQSPAGAGYNASQLALKAAGRSTSTVNMPPQEKEEQKARGALLVAEYAGISSAAKMASKLIPVFDTNLNILDKGFTTGFGTEAKTAGAKVLAALGVPDAEKYATDAQLFQSKATETVLQKQLEQKGPQTESDAKRIDIIGAQPGKTTEANKAILTIAKEQLKRDIEQRNFYDSWWAKNKTYDGAESAWYQGEGGKSLFDRPALKKYGAMTNPAEQIPTQNVTPAVVAAPLSAIGYLRANPSMKSAFDAKYGAGAADRALKGQ